MNELISFLKENNITCLENEPMKNHTSFKIGGSVRALAVVETKRQLADLLCYCGKNSIEYFLLGNGSNVLFDDTVSDRLLIIKLAGDFCQIRLCENGTVYAGAGALLISVCRFALEHSLSGLEFAYGIPGSVGGAVFMNAGAYDGELKNTVFRCEHMEKNAAEGELRGDELCFGYRKSAYQQNNFIITGAYFTLAPADKEQIEGKMKLLMQKRRDKQPLEFPSAGSVFRRPPGHFAAALIEQCGLKGVSVGGAEVSKKHSGFIINTGGATCRDVKKLIELCQKKVYERFSVMLEPEIRFI